MATLKIKRIYERKESADGYRILVDRLWPRGLKKENVLFDIWMKAVAPSSGLRKWFNHDISRWKKFAEMYTTELETSTTANELLQIIKQHKVVTLLYSAKDENHNQAAVLHDYIKQRLL